MAPTATGPAPSSSNALPSSSSSAPMPGSHEEAQARYLSLKADLDAALVKKRAIDQTLSDLESQIWLYEGSYFQTTAASGGNIVKGFDNYLKGAQATGGRGAAAAAQSAIENGEIPPEDRVFSGSSLTYQRSLELKAAEEMAKQANANKKEGANGGGGGTGSSGHAAKSSKKEKREKEKAAAAAGKDEDEGAADETTETKPSKKDSSSKDKEGAKEKKEKKRRREE
ncbi:unnamed protein product [Jaminaea pallidilutea]